MQTVYMESLHKDISRICLGTWAIGGGPAWGQDPKRAVSDEMNAVAAIKACPNAGINVIDTAPAYNFGNSERIVGKALKGMDRSRLCVITKFGIVWDREGAPFNKVGSRQLYKNLSSASVLHEIDASLERLGTDYIDVYMSHWQAEEPYYTPIGETIEVLNKLKDEGKIRAIGAANVTPEQVREYCRYGKLDIVQAKYSLLDRKIEEELLPVCIENGVILQAYSPLEMGLLSGTLPRSYKPVGAQCNKKWFQPENLPKVFHLLDQLKPLCEKYNCTIADLAMAWILAQNENIILLSGCSRPEHVMQNAHAADIALSRGDAAMMRELAESLDK